MHRDAGQNRAVAVRSALSEIAKPLVGSTITPIVVFLPLISITGVTGVFFRALALTVGVALLTSLLLALTWTPTLSHYLVRRKGTGGHESKPTGMIAGLVRVHERLLRGVIAYPAAFALFVAGVVGGSAYCYQSLGSDLLPAIDEGGFILDYLTPAGSSLTETNRVLQQVEAILQSTPEVENTSRRTGLQLGLAQVTEANTGDFTVRLKKNRTRSVDEVISDVRDRIADQLPGLEVEFPQLLTDMIGDLTSSPEPVEIKLFSQDPALLAEWAPQVAEAIQKVHGVVDVMDGIGNAISGPAVTFQVDSVAAARAGFSPEEVQTNVSALLQGEPAAAPVIRDGRSYTIRVRYPEAARASNDTIRDTPLVSVTGRTATIGSITRITELPGQAEIRRENLQRDVVVTARLEGVNLGDGIAAVPDGNQRSQSAARDPRRVWRYVPGAAKILQDLVVVLALAILLVFVVLLL